MEVTMDLLGAIFMGVLFITMGSIVVYWVGLDIIVTWKKTKNIFKVLGSFVGGLLFSIAVFPMLLAFPCVHEMLSIHWYELTIIILFIGSVKIEQKLKEEHAQ